MDSLELHAVKCAVCLESFNELERKPLVLDCGHTFCAKCIGTNSLVNSGGSRCFSCRAVIAGKVSNLRPNYALLQAMSSSDTAAGVDLIALLK